LVVRPEEPKLEARMAEIGVYSFLGVGSKLVPHQLKGMGLV